MGSYVSKAVNMINRLIKPAGIQLVSRQADQFGMAAAMKRIPAHGIRIDTVIDIGGSTGVWSVEAMKIFPKAAFVSIEPLAEREAALRRLAQRFPHLAYELCAAGDVDGATAMLSVADDLDGSTIDGRGKTLRPVPVKTIDTIVAERNLTGTFLLKFDTHGYEAAILSGATQTLQHTAVIVMEAYNFRVSDHALRFHEMCTHLENLGFRCYDIADPMLRAYDHAFWQMDLFFCRSDANIFAYLDYL